jgi:hypothetical protein
VADVEGDMEGVIELLDAEYFVHPKHSIRNVIIAMRFCLFMLQYSKFNSLPESKRITPELTGRGIKHSISNTPKDDDNHSIRAPVE